LANKLTTTGLGFIVLGVVACLGVVAIVAMKLKCTTPETATSQVRLSPVKPDVMLTPVSGPDVEELNFSETATTLSTATDTRTSPFSGYIKKVIVNWPEGCNNLVEVIFNHKTNQILPYPSRDGLILTGTHSFDLNHFVKQGDSIEMYVINHDNTFSHTVTAVMKLQGVE